MSRPSSTRRLSMEYLLYYKERFVNEAEKVGFIAAEINEEGLIQLFYKGLKDEVKDELYKIDRPDTLNEYIAIAIRIDDRQYLHKQQRKGRTRAPQAYKPNDKKRRLYLPGRETATIDARFPIKEAAVIDQYNQDDLEDAIDYTT
ncbi:hypothetical protein NEMBOFW57_003549 [Staphylotrichum longicolle]|uniref:Uncharacterized protein n=1 Tax=Staphylotrichum longicolle TaxID=669026 RepID=A0AAD4F828_9PEZI|nr:hypothetical protein NEMBOFW57_003549 [Staphylotrichum longicolle]